jgi:type III secretion system TyeA family effector delivery regulator
MAGVSGLSNQFQSQVQSDEPESPKPFTQMASPRGPSLPTQQTVQNGALAEAMESMSLVMGSRLRTFERKQEDKTRGSVLGEKLATWVPKVTGPALAELMSQFSHLGSEPRNPLEILQQAGISASVMALLLAGLIQEKGMSASRQRRLAQALATLLEDETLPVDMFAWLELDQLEKHSLVPIKMLYERSRKGEDSPETLLAWYHEVSDWPDREKRLKVLIQALAMELNIEGDRSQLIRIVSAIQELKRLLLFFNLAEHSLWVANAGGMRREIMLREILNMLSQLWIYMDWVAERLNSYSLPLNKQIAWTHAMLEFIRTLPSLCFRDDEHQGQIVEALEQLQDQLADAE